MDIQNIGRILKELRISKNMTQRQVADIIGVVPKTVSKWETGNGMPDVSVIPLICDIFGISERVLLSGDMNKNTDEVGNMKKTKFYVCKNCGSIMSGTGDFSVNCCGVKLLPQEPKQEDEKHSINIKTIDNEYYIELNHDMTKEHYISFISYVTYDKVLTVRLYPEQDCSVQFPRLHGGKFFYYCNNHGLFEVAINIKKSPQKNNSLNSLLTLAQYSKENIIKGLFSDEEISNTAGYSQSSPITSLTVTRSNYFNSIISSAHLTGTKQYVICGDIPTTFFANEKYRDCDIFIVNERKNIESIKEKLVQKNMKLAVTSQHYEDIVSVLKKQGFDTQKKAVFLIPSLFMIYNKARIGNILRDISTCTSGTSVAFDIADNHFISNKQKNEFDFTVKSCFGYEELENYLEDKKYLIYEFINESDIKKMLPKNLTAPNGINYVLATVQ